MSCEKPVFEERPQPINVKTMKVEKNGKIQILSP